MIKLVKFIANTGRVYQSPFQDAIQRYSTVSSEKAPRRVTGQQYSCYGPMPAVLTADHFLPPVQPGEMLNGPGQCSGLGLVHGLNYGACQQTLITH